MQAYNSLLLVLELHDWLFLLLSLIFKIKYYLIFPGSFNSAHFHNATLDLYQDVMIGGPIRPTDMQDDIWAQLKPMGSHRFIQ